jgi:diguanylate cyclase (GGDEF)-like protein
MPASPGRDSPARTKDVAADGELARPAGSPPSASTGAPPPTGERTAASTGTPRAPGDRTAPPRSRPAGRSPKRPRHGGPTVGRRPRRIAVIALLGALIAGLVVLFGGQAYWLCVPAALFATAQSRTRAGVAAITIALVAAGEGAGIASAVHGRPPLALALLVPAASVSVLLALRERLESQREALRRSALTDPLTGLAKRRSLLARIDYEVSRHTRARRPFGVMMIDLDGFKALNDRFGHPAGDDLLRDVGAAIARAIRDQDTAARLGGDEFCVLAPETDLAGTQQLCERVLAAVASVTAGIEALGASAGIALFPGDGAQAMFLLEAADQQLLEAKRRRGRGHRRRAA